MRPELHVITSCAYCAQTTIPTRHGTCPWCDTLIPDRDIDRDIYSVQRALEVTIVAHAQPHEATP